jgi:hypothetical protein
LKEENEKLLGLLSLNEPLIQLNRDSKRMGLKKRVASSVLTLIYSLMKGRRLLKTIAYATALLDTY